MTNEKQVLEHRFTSEIYNQNHVLEKNREIEELGKEIEFLKNEKNILKKKMNI